MFEHILKRMREKIRTRQYVMTTHAEEEMNDDGYTVYDVERGVLTGQILECQRDVVTRERKYRVQGEDLAGGMIEVVAKFGISGKVVFLTVYRP